MKLKLINNWRSVLKMLSVQFNTLGVALTATYVTMYDKLKDHVDPTLMGIITIAVFVLSIAGRMVDQGLGSDDA